MTIYIKRTELIKSKFNIGERPNFYFWRDSNGNEIDVIVEEGQTFTPIEIKAGRTLSRDAFAPLRKWCSWAGESVKNPMLIYAGDTSYEQHGISVVPWRLSGERLE